MSGLGLEWGPVSKGAAELAGIDPGVLEEFSRRRHEMRREAENGGLALDTKRRSEKAAIATRERKQYGVETHTWREEVQARAAEHGLDRRGVARLVDGGSAARASAAGLIALSRGGCARSTTPWPARPG